MHDRPARRRHDVDQPAGLALSDLDRHDETIAAPVFGADVAIRIAVRAQHAAQRGYVHGEIVFRNHPIAPRGLQKIVLRDEFPHTPEQQHQ